MTAGTYSNYARHYAMLLVWLSDNDLPTQLAGLTPQMLVQCWDDVFQAGYCYPTPNNMRCAVAMRCRESFMPPPYVTDHPSVKSALEGYRRLAAHRSKKRQPIGEARMEQLLRNMKRVCPWVPVELWSLITASFLLAYRGFLRISEVKGLRRRHVVITAQEITCFIQSSKSDRLGHGVTVHIHDQRVIQLMQHYWLVTAHDAYLFPLDPTMLNTIIEQTAKAVRWVGYFSFHSFRHGAATDLWRRTHNLPLLMARGRWRSKGAARYYLHDLDTDDY